MEHLAGIARELSSLSGLRCEPAPRRRVAGGSINESYAWAHATGLLFVKVGARAARAAFVAEAAGLEALARTHTVRVPRVLGCAVAGDAAFLALEWIESRPADARAQARLGAGLAALHANCAARFGYGSDNLIGRTPQVNAWAADWAVFFREQRLAPQFALAEERGFGPLLAEPGARLLGAVPALLAGHRPAASLLHGDLWGGNWLVAADGEPVIFDPAVYYGDREADLAMTRLFGGFGGEFYRAYDAAAAPAPGWQERSDLYNLYHVLNHANLFGEGYARQARALIEHLLAALRG